MEPQPGIEWFEENGSPAVIKAVAHPIRIAVMSEAARRPVSAKEMAAELEEPLPKISYHVRVLADAGLLEPVRRTRRRGAIETHYRAVTTVEISNRTLSRISPELHAAFYEALVNGLANDLSASIRSGGAENDDYLYGRLHFKVGAEGRDRMYALVGEFYDELSRLEREYDREGPPEDEPVQHVSVALAVFEGRIHNPSTATLSVGARSAEAG